MTDHGDRFSLPVHFSHEFLGPWLNAQSIRVQGAPGQQYSVELLGVSVCQRFLHVVLVLFVELIERLKLARLRRNQSGHCASLVEGTPWLSQLGIFNAVSSENRYPQS